MPRKSAAFIPTFMESNNRIPAKFSRRNLRISKKVFEHARCLKIHKDFKAPHRLHFRRMAILNCCAAKIVKCLSRKNFDCFTEN